MAGHITPEPRIHIHVSAQSSHSWLLLSLCAISSLLVLLMASTIAESLSIELPQGSATVSIPITVTWSLAKTDPTAFGLMEKDIDNNVIASVTPVQAGSASIGVAELTFSSEGCA